MAQLPVLQVLIPLLAAPLCVLLRSRTVAWLLFLLAGVGTFAVAVLLSLDAGGQPPVHYEVGGWEAPYGIEFVIGDFNLPVLLLLTLLAALVAIYARPSITAEISPHGIPLVYTCLCLCLTGLVGLTITGDAFNAFVFLEISSLSTYALVAMGGRRRALIASLRYLVIGTVGATFVLLGIGMAYAVTGTLNMDDLAERLAGVHDNNALHAAVVFVFIGLAVKMAMIPLHAWLPGAYSEAPSAVSTFIAGVSTKVSIYVFCRFTFTVFGTALVFDTMPVDRIALPLAAVSMLVASAVACFQSNLKYVLAWSSIAQIGYILAGISLGTEAGVAAGYLHLVNHGITKAALFAIAGLLVLRLGSVDLTGLAGLARRMPITFGALVVAGLGLIGVPPTAGFASKWALAGALIDRDQWLVLAAMLLSSLLALIYVGRVIAAAWFGTPEQVAPQAAREADEDVPSTDGAERASALRQAQGSEVGAQGSEVGAQGSDAGTTTPEPVEGHNTTPEPVEGHNTTPEPVEGHNTSPEVAPHRTSPEPVEGPLPKAPVPMMAVIAVLVGLSLYFGIDATLPAGLADAAAAALLGFGGE